MTFSRTKARKVLSPSEAFVRISRYCAYQERSHKQVRDKLYDYGLYSSQVEELLTKLITDGFLNEERFAKAFAGGKFRMKKWGRNKIVHRLEAQGVTPKCIEKGLREIDADDYQATLEKLIIKKFSVAAGATLFEKRNKTAQFAISKGFEPELTWKILKQLTDK